jgi:hypothetical protein
VLFRLFCVIWVFCYLVILIDLSFYKCFFETKTRVDTPENPYIYIYIYLVIFVLI